MNHLILNSMFLTVMTVLLLPLQANASAPAAVPEPVSLALLATGIAGLGTAEVIRRRRRK